MAHRFVFSIKDLESGVHDVQEPLPCPWLQEILDDTDVTVPPSPEGLLEASLTPVSYTHLTQPEIHPV